MTEARSTSEKGIDLTFRGSSEQRRTERSGSLRKLSGWQKLTAEAAVVFAAALPASVILANADGQDAGHQATVPVTLMSEGQNEEHQLTVKPTILPTETKASFLSNKKSSSAPNVPIADLCHVEVTSGPYYDPVDKRARAIVTQDCYDGPTAGDIIMDQYVEGKLQDWVPCITRLKYCWKTRDDKSKEKHSSGELNVGLSAHCRWYGKEHNTKWRVEVNAHAKTKKGSDGTSFDTPPVILPCRL